MSQIAVRDQVSKRFQWFHVGGDSAASPINVGDSVIVDCCDTLPTPPGLFVVGSGQDLVVRRIEFLAHSQPPRAMVWGNGTEKREVPLASIPIQGRVLGKWQMLQWEPTTKARTE
jgi:hypothetical protein